MNDTHHNPHPTDGKTVIECQECMRRFRRTIKPTTCEIRCPNCGGYDTMPVDLLGAGRVG